MALILNKDLTTNFTDLSGITGLTYYNIEYIDNFGVSHTDPYLVIDEITIDKKQKYVRIVITIYHNKNSRISNKLNIQRDIYITSNDDYDIYFSNNILSYNNIFKQGYIYLNEKILTNWKSDEI